MMNVLCLAGMLFAGQWGPSAAPADNAEQGLLGGGAVGQGLLGGGAVVGGSVAPKGSGPHRVPILTKAETVEPPDRAEILRALPPVQRGIPNVYEVWRDDVEFKVEKLVDKVDAPRFFPLAGTAKLHHLHWKCTVSYYETVKIWLPIPMIARTKRTEIVYIDKDRLILCDAPKEDQAGNAKCPCEAKPEHRIVACWDSRVHACEDAVNSPNKLPVLKGSVYLHCQQTNKPVCAKGTMRVEACDRAGRKLAEWHFDAASLDKLQRTDRIGVGYTLCLPLDQRCLAEKDLRLTLTYRTSDGKSCCDEPTRLVLNCDKAGVIQAAYMEAVKEKSCKQMTFTEIVTLSKRGISDDVIVRQMELTGSMYDLTTEQILSLHENGVSNIVIRAMQDRRPAPATPSAQPSYRIHGGVGPASSSI